MQIETQSYQLPQYQSAILKKQRQSKHLSPKVTHVYPQIKEVEKIKIKRHHLDDTEVRQVLSYDYEENPQPKQYLFRGSKFEYDKNENLKSKKQPFSSPRNNHFGLISNPKNMNSQYFDRELNINNFQKPQRDGNYVNESKKNTDRNFEPQQNQTRLKKSISTSDFQSFRKEQNQMENKVLNKLTKLQTQNDRINQYLIQTKQKSAHQKPQIQRYKSEDKRYSMNQEFNKLKNKLQRQRTKQKERLHNELNKIKQESKKLKEEQRQRKKSFKQLIQKTNNKIELNSKNLQNQRPPAPSIQTINSDMDIMTARKLEFAENENLIKEKLNQIEKKLLPKTNIVNKRIQCEIYDPRADYLKRFEGKPPFRYNSQSDTDSQFSDF